MLHFCGVTDGGRCPLMMTRWTTIRGPSFRFLSDPLMSPNPKEIDTLTNRTLGEEVKPRCSANPKPTGTNHHLQTCPGDPGQGSRSAPLLPRPLQTNGNTSCRRYSSALKKKKKNNPIYVCLPNPEHTCVAEVKRLGLLQRLVFAV